MRLMLVGASGLVAVFAALLGACSSRDLPSRDNTDGLGGYPAQGGAAGVSTEGGASGSAGAAGGSAGTFNIPEDAVKLLDAVRIQTLKEVPHQRRATADLDFGTGPYAKATLFVNLETSCYPFEKWRDNPPPEGQTFPADCDAFDRNFEISLDNPESAESGPPGIELVRAITPFGGPMQLALDITDIANGLPGMHKLGAWIAVYSDTTGKVTGSNAGWTVTVAVKLEPGASPRKVLGVIPLSYAEQKVKDSPEFSFEVPAGTTRGRIEYRATGHGQGAVGPNCVGPAEEFCARTHSLFVDATGVDQFDPWRDDCQTLCTRAKSPVMTQEFCAENPCGLIASVEAPRANWCPGSVTPPRVIESPLLATPGVHKLSWTISELLSGGHWRISATYFAYGD